MAPNYPSGIQTTGSTIPPRLPLPQRRKQIVKFDAEKFRRQILATRYKDTAWVDIQDGKVVGELPPRVPVPEQWAAWESRQKDLYAKKMRLDETEGGGGGGGATKKEKDPVEVISKDNSKGNSVTYAGDCEMVDGDFLTPGPDTSITTEDSQLSIGKTRNGVGDSDATGEQPSRDPRKKPRLG